MIRILLMGMGVHLRVLLSPYLIVTVMDLILVLFYAEMETLIPDLSMLFGLFNQLTLRNVMKVSADWMLLDVQTIVRSLKTFTNVICLEVLNVILLVVMVILMML